MVLNRLLEYILHKAGIMFLLCLVNLPGWALIFILFMKITLWLSMLCFAKMCLLTSEAEVSGVVQRYIVLSYSFCTLSHSSAFCWYFFVDTSSPEIQRISPEMILIPLFPKFLLWFFSVHSFRYNCPCVSVAINLL